MKPEEEVETIKVDMSSKAIDARLREVSDLRDLGLSIEKAKMIKPNIDLNEKPSQKNS